MSTEEEWRDFEFTKVNYTPSSQKIEEFRVAIWYGKYGFYRSSGSRAIRRFDTEQEAVDYGVIYMARRKGGMMWIHYPSALIKKRIKIEIV